MYKTYPLNLLFLLLMGLLCCYTGFTQQSNFIHIQSENNQPFLVTLGTNTYGSSATGYLVIPQVPEGEQKLIIGFPGNQFPEYSFLCTMTNKPLGFSLKQAVDNSLSLFDMVNFAVLKGNLYVKVAPNEVLVKVVEKEAEPLNKAVVNTDSEMLASKPLAKKEMPALIKEPEFSPATSSIRKIFEKATPGGLDQVYIVINNGLADTVALFIPELAPVRPRQGAWAKPDAISMPIYTKTTVYGMVSRFPHSSTLN